MWMQRVLRWWEALSLPLRAAVGAAAWGILLSGGYFGLYQPKGWAVEELRGQAKNQESELRRHRERLRRNPLPAPSERESWERAGMLVGRKVPPQEDMPRLLEEVVKVVGSRSVVAIEFPKGDKSRKPGPSPSRPAAPGAPAGGERKGLTLGSSLVRVSFLVPFDGVGPALRRILSGSRWVGLEALKLQNDGPQVRVDLTLRAYHGSDGAAS